MVSFRQFELARYNNWHLHKERNSRLFCLPCAFVLRTDDFRRKALVVTTEGIHFFQRKSPQDRELLTNLIFYTPPKPPFIICVPSDYRKHIVLRTRINYKQTDFQIQYGEDAVYIHPDDHKRVFEAVKLMYETGTAPKQIWNTPYEPLLASWLHSPLLSFIFELAKPMMKEE